jgi:mannosyltransferase OCH1-like enzyme
MIPKIIHYCWFGERKKPTFVKKCINSWKKHCPDYKFVEWGNNNFDINCNPYVSEAYNRRKYAFVSDYVRLYALYNYGGIYMDTDVEVFKSFDNILDNKCVFGFEECNYIATSFMAAEKGNKFIEKFFELYKSLNFKNADGSLNMKTNVERLTELLLQEGLQRNNSLQTVSDIKIYPKEYFSPYDYINCVKHITKNSYCMHHFYVSWMPITERFKKSIKKIIAMTVGDNFTKFLRGKFSDHE